MKLRIFALSSAVGGFVAAVAWAFGGDEELYFGVLDLADTPTGALLLGLVAILLFVLGVLRLQQQRHSPPADSESDNKREHREMREAIAANARATGQDIQRVESKVDQLIGVVESFVREQRQQNNAGGVQAQLSELISIVRARNDKS